MFTSIIIPNLNSPIIDRTIAGILAQEGFDPAAIEVIVVGRDEPGLVIRQSDTVRLVDTGRPMAPAPARNLGVAHSRGELLCFLDADCIPAADWLARLTAAYAADPGLAILGGGVAFADDNYWTLADNIASFYPYLATTSAGERAQLPSLNLSCRRRVWDRVGPFDERYPFPACEDSDWSTRARLAGYRLQFEPRAVVSHHPARSSLRHLWQHAVRFGYYSIKVDPRYWPIVGRPWPFRSRWALLGTAPGLAAAVTVRAFVRDRALWRHAATAPAVFAAKLGWCWGAARRLGELR